MKQAKKHGKTQQAKRLEGYSRTQLHWIVTLDNEIVATGSKELTEIVANQLLKMSGQEGSAKAEPYLV